MRFPSACVIFINQKSLLEMFPLISLEFQPNQTNQRLYQNNLKDLNKYEIINNTFGFSLAFKEYNFCFQETTSSLIKDRSRIEAEYAKNLRSLVQKYSPKEPKVRVNANAQQNPANGPMSIMSINTTPEEEYTHIKAFKKVRITLILSSHY